MSRTYRLRHEPVLPGTAKKFAFGVGNTRGAKTRGHLVKELIRELGYEPNRTIWCRYWEAPNGVRYSFSREEHRLLDTLEKETVYPIAHPSNHPWFTGLGGISCKKYYRVRANRLTRHKVKEKLNHNNPDFDSLILKTSNDFFNVWDFV